jgi:hypothetical protein
MNIPTKSDSGGTTIHTAFTVAAVVGVMIVLIASFMAITATGP